MVGYNAVEGASPKPARKLNLSSLPGENELSKDSSNSDQVAAAKSSTNTGAALQGNSPEMPSLEDISPTDSHEQVPAIVTSVVNSDSDTIVRTSSFRAKSSGKITGRKWKRKWANKEKSDTGVHNTILSKKRDTCDNMKIDEQEKKSRLIGVFQDIYQDVVPTSTTDLAQQGH